MKKAIKYFISIVTVLLVTGIIFAIIFISKLPSANEIRQKISGKAAAPAATEQITKIEKELPEAVTTPKVQEPEKALINKSQEGNSSSKVVDDLVFNSERPLANICEHLGEAPRSPMFDENEKKDFFQSIIDAAEQNPDDPFANAVFAPVRFALRLPSAKIFFDEIREAEAKGEQNLMEKVGFYAKGVAAYNEIQSSNPLINNVSNHAYYLFLMGQVIKKNPQLSLNPETQSYCQQLQRNLQDGMYFDSEKAAQEMLKFLEYAHVTPEEVKFDPNFKSEVKVEFTNHNFKIGFGWIGKYLN